MGIRLVLSKKTEKKLHEKLAQSELLGDLKAFKRIQSVLMFFQGCSYSNIAAALNCSHESVRLWFKDFMFRSINFIKYQSPPGRPSRLTKNQKKELSKIIDDGPECYGFSGGCWRTPMLQKVIYEKFGVFYSCHYISTLLKNMGYSYQKATFVSAKRDDEQRRIWIEKIWPQILKEAKNKDSFIFFGDECSFSLRGSLSYTWSKKGVQPEVKSNGSKKNYKVFGVIDYFSGKFLSMGYDGKLNSDSYTEFLKEVLRRTRKHVILIQDGAGYHTSDDMEDFFCSNCHRLSIYNLPSHSPDFNPIEKLWKKIKEKGTHLKYFPTFDSLMYKVEEMLIKFENSKQEILKLFGLYTKLENRV